MKEKEQSDCPPELLDYDKYLESRSKAEREKDRPEQKASRYMGQIVAANEERRKERQLYVQLLNRKKIKRESGGFDGEKVFVTESYKRRLAKITPVAVKEERSGRKQQIGKLFYKQVRERSRQK